jgi:hypothetical protein
MSTPLHRRVRRCALSAGAGDDGALWVTNLDQGTLLRIPNLLHAHPHDHD